MAGALPRFVPQRRGVRALRACSTGLLRLLLVLGAVLVAAQARAACGSARDCLQEIERAQAGTRSLRARFVQTKHLSLLDDPLVSRGRFAFQRPDRVLWAVEDPQPMRVVIRGATVQIPGLSDRDREALALAPLTTMLTQFGAVFTGAVDQIERSFEVMAADDAARVRLTLVPRREEWKRLFRVIRLEFERPQLTVHAIELEDALGDTLDVEFQEVERNPDLPESTFDAR